LQYRAIEHWDGKLPEYSAGALPLLTFDLSKMERGDEGSRQKLLEKLLQETKPPAVQSSDAPATAAPPAPAAPTR